MALTGTHRCCFFSGNNRRIFLNWIVLSLIAFGAVTAAAATTRSTATIGASFDAFWGAAQGRPFEEQVALWDRFIERPREDLYASVVWETRDYPGWQQTKERSLRRTFAEYPGHSDQILAAAREWEKDVPLQAMRFRKLFPDAPARPSVELVLAPNFDAKSGVLGNGTPVLVFAVDSLVLEHADMSIIFPHELFHLYQANHAGIENDGVMPGADLTLPLSAEGIATYVSSLLAPGHSDGQLLLQATLGTIPAERLPEVARRFLMDADAKAIDPTHPEAFGRWFMGSNTAYQADLPSRSGYWLALQLIRRMSAHYSLQQLASWPAAKAQQETRAALLEITGDIRRK